MQVAHVRGQGESILSECRTLPSAYVAIAKINVTRCWWKHHTEPELSWTEVHDCRVLHDQARHDARVEDALARPADEGRRPAAIRRGSRSQAVSPSHPNGATPAR